MCGVSIRRDKFQIAARLLVIFLLKMLFETQ